MDPRTLQILSDILKHLDNSQGMGLKSLLDNESKETPADEASESPDQEALEQKLGLDDKDDEDKSPMDSMPGMKPKGLSVEKVSVMGKDPKLAAMGGDDSGGDDQEMSDDELEELIKKLTG